MAMLLGLATAYAAKNEAFSGPNMNGEYVLRPLPFSYPLVKRDPAG